VTWEGFAQSCERWQRRRQQKMSFKLKRKFLPKRHFCTNFKWSSRWSDFSHYYMYNIIKWQLQVPSKKKYLQCEDMNLSVWTLAFFCD
jgi:hypothetical protein